MDEENNNEWYLEWIPRVSNLVSYIYPFKWTEDERRYINWLIDKWIDKDEYLWWANELWTFVHKQLEQHSLWKKIDKKNKLYKEVNKLIDNGIMFLRGVSDIKNEVYLSDDRIQGTTDIIYRYWWKLCLWDYKTYWVVKRRYWLDNKFKVDTGKRKKVQLQLSFYAYLYEKIYNEKIEEIHLVYLHDEWYKIITLDIIPKEEIEKIIDDYYRNIINKDKYITF